MNAILSQGGAPPLSFLRNSPPSVWGPVRKYFRYYSILPIEIPKILSAEKTFDTWLDSTTI